MRLFDLHCDTLTVCMDHSSDLYSNRHHVDIERASHLFDQWGQVFAVYIPDHYDEEAAWQRVCRAVSYFQRAQTSTDPRASFCQFHLSLENGAGIGADLTRLHTLAEQGVRSVNLTWNGGNRLGNGCMSQDTSGLSAFGKEAVRCIYAERMIPDVSHLNECGFWDVAQIAESRPFVASHSLSRRVWDHPRSLSDEQFRAVADVNGLVGLNLCSDQLGGNGELADRFRRHLDHFLELGGEHVLALGMDLDGTNLDESYRGIRVAVYLYEELLKKAYTEALLDRIFFQNSFDFFEKTLTSGTECIKIGT